MKLCPGCIAALGREDREGLCARCARKLEAVLRKPGDAPQWPPFWDPEPGEGILVPGMSGMGKSTYQKAFARFLMARGRTVFAWDAAREFSVAGIERDRTPLGPLLRQVTVSELEADPEEVLCSVYDGAVMPAVAIVPDAEYPSREERAADFVRAMGIMLPNLPKGGAVVFLTECGLLEGETEAEQTLVEIATTWRKEDVSPVFDTQSANAVHVRARGSVRVIVALKQVDVADRTALTRLVSRRFADAVEALPPHHALLADRMNLRKWKDSGVESGAEDAA